jgi:hypothetical protein
MAYKPAYIWNGTSFDQIGNQAVATLNDYVLLVGAQTVSDKTLTSTTLTSPVINTATISGGSADSVYLISPSEKITISATAATGTVDFDCITQGIVYYTTDASANFTLNFRGNGSNTLNSIMSIGESLSVVFLNTNGATARYPNAFQIDGASVTPKWSGGTAPSSGNASAIDAYSFSIIKTANATFTVLASTGKFA